MSGENSLRLLHLCPDLMNLYGDYANLLALSRALCAMGAQVKIEKIPFGSDIELSGAALLYMGPGTETRLELARRWLSGFSGELCAAARDGLPFMLMGNAAELACAEIRNGDEALPALSLFEACARRTQGRQVGDILYTSDLSDMPLAGYINKSGFIKTDEKPLFCAMLGPGGMEDGEGNELPLEGLQRDNVFASYAIGPALMQNPWLKNLIARRVLARSLPSLEPCEPARDYTDDGYDITVSELKKRIAP